MTNSGTRGKGEKIDCQGTDQIVCPYCGNEREFDGDGDPSGQTQCCECDKWFEVEADYSVTFSSSKLDCKNGSPHNWRKTDFEVSKINDHYSCRTCRKTELRAKS